MRGRARAVASAAALLLAAAPLAAASGVVPSDFQDIQSALDQAVPGDTIQVMPNVYFEKIVFTSGGDALDGYVTLEAYPGGTPVLDGTGVPGADMVLIQDKSYVRISGFEIRNNLGVNDGSGVRVLGAGTRIEIQGNHIHDIRGRHAMGITIYGTDPVVSISHLLIGGNYIHDCEPASSEALVLNGNVEQFDVSHNVVEDVNNIGIDFIGGEDWVNPDPTKVARDGTCSSNRVFRARDGDNGWAAGIYVDGGQDIVIEHNEVTGCNLGIEVGAENSGTVASGIVVRNNVVYANQVTCLVFGGYQASVGRVRDCLFLNNTCYGNDTRGEGLGELWIQYAEDNVVRNNIFHGQDETVLLYSEGGDINNDLDYNLWYAPGGAEFTWRGNWYGDLGAYQAGSGQDANSLFGDPLFEDPATDDFHLADGSPAIDRGDPASGPEVGRFDMDGEERIMGLGVDIGADEYFQADCVAQALASPLTALICEGQGLSLTDDGSSADCPAGGSLVFEWYDGPVGDPGSTLVGTGPDLGLPQLPLGRHTYDLLVYCDNDPACRASLATPIDIQVFEAPDAVRGLRLVGSRGALVLGFAWDPDLESALYRVYSVEAAAGLPPRGDNPAATLRCATNNPTPTCFEPDGRAGTGIPLLFYEVVGACTVDPAFEGPN